MKKSAFWLLLLTLTVFSLLPVEFLPPPSFSVWDKAQHALGFAALTGLGLWAYPRLQFWMPLLMLLHGGFIEVTQAATGWRRGEWLDLLGDAVGIVFALLIARTLTRLRRLRV